MKTINIKGILYDISQPLVMGILNITPDSFYKGSHILSVSEALNRVQQISSEGGTIIDIGAQSTHPRSQLLSADEEINRLRPVLKAINKEYPEVIMSIDTFYADVARFCVEEHGIAIINDISGGNLDERMFDTVAMLNVPYILMHMKGTPQTMQKYTDYDNLIGDISYYFSEKIAQLHVRGVNDIILDLGFGFSKNLKQNYELINQMSFFENFELPLLVGISRKSMITKLLNNIPSEALNGTTVLNTYALMNGANILRVHDVKEAADTIRILAEIKDSAPLK